jgi:hypothetical protein
MPDGGPPCGRPVAAPPGHNKARGARAASLQRCIERFAAAAERDHPISQLFEQRRRDTIEDRSRARRRSELGTDSGMPGSKPALSGDRLCSIHQ